MATFAFLDQAENRNWQTGTLIKSEHVKVRDGSAESTGIDGYLNDSRYAFSPNDITTTTRTDIIETYQVFTIRSGQTTYVVREHLALPWSKPASSDVGRPIRFSVENSVLYILDGHGRQHKTEIIKVSLKTVREPGPQPV
jgi:hypothetical protein